MFTIHLLSLVTHNVDIILQCNQKGTNPKGHIVYARPLLITRVHSIRAVITF